VHHAPQGSQGSLSIPTAIMVVTGVGAKNRILIKGGHALKASPSLKRAALDKTGMVTEGKLMVVSVAWMPQAWQDAERHCGGDGRCYS
jgi:Cu+-exporting ATPase